MDNRKSKFRWIVFVSVMLTYLLMSSQRTAPGLITNQLMGELHVTASTIGLLASIQFLVYTGLQIPMGILADRYGPNFFLIFGATLTGLGTIIYSLSTYEGVLFIARSLTGLGDATIWVNMVIILGQWFKAKEFVRLIGFAGMTGSLGFLLATVPFSKGIDFLGWRTMFFFTGWSLCLCGLLLYFVLIKVPKHSLISVKTESGREKIGKTLIRMVFKRQAWALFFCHFGLVGAFVGFVGSWAVSYGMDMYDMSRSEASKLNMIGIIGALIGAPLSSWISSLLGKVKKLYMTVHIIILLSWACFLLFKGNPSLILLFFLFFIIGLCYGASTLTFAVVRKTFPLKEVGLVTGFANTGGFLSAVLLPSVFGFVLERAYLATGSMTVGYERGFIIPVIFSVVGLIGVLIIQEDRSQEIEFSNKKT
ncbi:MFS transporter [Niallia sp. XMNu-256]|uniref:MFS transporter n=1 Tax=Niallia sp. XMNu-256 TaxID=3082444 RepID=UPI0030CB1BA5